MVPRRLCSLRAWKKPRVQCCASPGRRLRPLPSRGGMEALPDVGVDLDEFRGRVPGSVEARWELKSDSLRSSKWLAAFRIDTLRLDGYVEVSWEPPRRSLPTAARRVCLAQNTDNLHNNAAETRKARFRGPRCIPMILLELVLIAEAGFESVIFGLWVRTCRRLHRLHPLHQRLQRFPLRPGGPTRTEFGHSSVTGGAGRLPHK
jgi:hypothetical protein